MNFLITYPDAYDQVWNDEWNFNNISGQIRGESMEKELLESALFNDGSTASWYELPPGATELKHLIWFKNMNAQVGEIFRSCYRLNDCPHSDAKRNLKKIIAYAEQELERLEMYE